MGKKIFVSYKYADGQVENLIGNMNSTVRDYLDIFEATIDSSDDIYKGESDGEDLSNLKDEVIWDKLKDRIYDSSVTIVFISPGMKEAFKSDRDQWIPWEIAYSLKETSRRNKNGVSVTSHSNAMLAVVLPDSTGDYSYYLEQQTCCDCNCMIHRVSMLFDIIKKNKFNRVMNVSKETCEGERVIWKGTCSYIEAVKWSDFIRDYQQYINEAVNCQANIDEYDICKEV